MALGRAMAVGLVPGLLDRSLTAGLSALPVVAAESPVALARIERWIRGMGHPLPRLACVPHPIYEKDIHPDPSVPKENRIVTVGRLQSSQKNLPLMLAVLGEFFQHHPDWSADLIGRCPPDLEQRLARLDPSVRSRIRFPGLIPHEDIASWYQRSKIYLITSRYEGFCNTVSESLCCGCSVVGAVDNAGMSFVTTHNSGTLACRPRKAHLLDALNAEVLAWNSGWRDAEEIARYWTSQLGSLAVAGLLVRQLKEIPSPKNCR